MRKRSLLLDSLELKDFLSHEDTRITFEKGIHVLAGENGAGKSSIVDALFLLLAQPQQPRSIRGGRKTDLIRRSTDKTVVTGEFTDEVTGDKFKIRAVISKHTSEAYVFKNKQVVASGVTAVRDYLRKEFYPEGLDPENMLANTTIIRQGGLANILDMISGGRVRTRKEYFQELLGLNEYEKAVDKLKNKGITIPLDPPYNKTFYPTESRENGLEAVNRDIMRTKQDLDKIIVNIKFGEDQVKQLSNKINKLEARKNDILIRLRELEEKRDQLKIKRTLMEVREKTLEEIVNGIRKLEDEKQEIKKKIAELEIPEDIGSLYNKVLIPLQETEYKIRELEPGISQLEEKLNEAKKALEEKGKAEEYEAVRSEIDRLNREIMELEHDIVLYRDSLKKLDEWKKKEEGFLAELETEGVPSETVENAIKDLQSIINGTKVKQNKVNERLRELEIEEESIKAKTKELKEKLDLISSGTSNRCPLCGHELSTGEMSDLGEKLSKQLEDLEQRTSQIEPEINRLRRERETIEQELVAFQELYMKAQSLNFSKPVVPDGLVGQITKMENEKKIMELSFSQLEEKKKELEPTWQAFHAIRRKYGNLEAAKQQIEQELAEKRRDLNILTDKRLSLTKKAHEYAWKWSLPEDLTKLVPLVKELLEKEKEKLMLQARLSEIESSISEKKEKKREIRREIENLEKEIAVLKEESKEYDKLRQDEENIEGELINLAQHKGRLEGELKKLKETRGMLSDYMYELRQVSRKLQILYKIRKILEELPSLILYETLKRLESQMTEIIRTFNLTYTGVSVDPETLEFKVLDPTGAEVSISQLSGGEQTAISLAFVVGLNKVLGGIMGFLVLDEPTTHLDPERRKSLVEIIENAVAGITGVRQLVLVTHHEEVKDAADVLCNVYKANGSSKVECE
ncbi:MAG: AAA family ATPase [Desulfurococcales archaeon]|nr:AAA family ATPase [Desulfurococcales archaeon]